MRKELADKHIKGSGIEIGGLHFPLPVPIGVSVAYIDRIPLEELIAENPGLDVKANNIIVDSAEMLEKVPSCSQDFVIANHVLEHCENPILALENWRRVLKPGGVIYAAIPIKNFTFDKKRECTPFYHILRDYIEGPDWSLRAHYEDWYANSEIEGRTGDDLKNIVELATAARSNIHFHVWDMRGIRELAHFVGSALGFKHTGVHENGSEAIMLLTD